VNRCSQPAGSGPQPAVVDPPWMVEVAPDVELTAVAAAEVVEAAGSAGDVEVDETCGVTAVDEVAEPSASKSSARVRLFIRCRSLA